MKREVHYIRRSDTGYSHRLRERFRSRFFEFFPSLGREIGHFIVVQGSRNGLVFQLAQPVDLLFQPFHISTVPGFYIDLFDQILILKWLRIEFLEIVVSDAGPPQQGDELYGCIDRCASGFNEKIVESSRRFYRNFRESVDLASRLLPSICKSFENHFGISPYLYPYSTNLRLALSCLNRSLYSARR